MKDNKIITRFQSKLTASLEVLIIGPLPLELDSINESLPHIYVDGGIMHMSKLSLPRDFITIGDGDSANDQKLNYTVSQFKDYSDLALALKIVGNRCKEIYLDGFTAKNNIEKRYDHFLANLGECYQWSKTFQGIIWPNTNFVILPKGLHHFFHHGDFSIISFEKTNLKLEGDVEYKVQKTISLQPMSSKGISNSAFGNVILTINRPILLILNWREL